MRLAPMNAERSMPYRPTAADIIDTSAQRLDMADDVSEFRRRIRGALFRVWPEERRRGGARWRRYTEDE